MRPVFSAVPLSINIPIAPFFTEVTVPLFTILPPTAYNPAEFSPTETEPFVSFKISEFSPYIATEYLFTNGLY